MQLNAALALGASVTMHVAWNLMARQQKPEAQALWWVLLAYLLLLAPWGLHSLFQETSLDARQALLLAGSAAANALYFLSLRRAYASAPVALVYPLVRSSPLPIALMWAFVAMMCTCCYSITDRAGTQQLTQFSSFLGYLSFGYCLGWLALCWPA